MSDSEDYNDARRQLWRFLDEVYMHKRIHSSFGYLTPAEFESQWLAERSAEWVVQQETPMGRVSGSRERRFTQGRFSSRHWTADCHSPGS